MGPQQQQSDTSGTPDRQARAVEEPKPEEQTRADVDTGATTAGLLPDGPGVALLVLVAGGVLVLGAALGYGMGPLAALCGAGALGAFGVRAATDGRGATGVALLWVTALVFAAAAAVVLGESGGGLGALLAGLGVASGALLAPCAVLGSTVRLYGHGAGQRVVRRYLLGTLLLGGVSAAVLVGAWLWSLGRETLPAVLTRPTLAESLAQQVVVAILVYGVGLVVTVRAARRFPVGVLLKASAFDRVVEARANVERAYRYGLWALGVYVVAAHVGLLVLASTEDELGTLRATLRASASRPLVVGLGAATAVLAGVLFVLWLLRSVGDLSRAAVAEVILPPAVVAVLATALVSLVPEPTGAVLDGLVAQTVFESFLTGVGPGVLVGALAVLFVASAVVFAVPTVVAAQGLGDESLAGIASATLAVVLVVVVAIAAGRGLVVVGGVALAAAVWEFGEFVTVASGELAVPSRGLPEGFGRLASVHAVATLAVTAGGVVFAALVFAVAAGTSLSTTAGTVALVVTGVGIAALTRLLNG